MCVSCCSPHHLMLGIKQSLRVFTDQRAHLTQNNGNKHFTQHTEIQAALLSFSAKYGR